jgi:predicted transcriptional regulator
MRAVLRLKEIDEAILPSVIAAKNAGISEERIAALAGITRGTVRNWLKRTTETEA